METSIRPRITTILSATSAAPDCPPSVAARGRMPSRSEEHTSELQSLAYLVCRLLLEKKKKKNQHTRLLIRPGKRSQWERIATKFKDIVGTVFEHSRPHVPGIMSHHHTHKPQMPPSSA